MDIKSGKKDFNRFPLTTSPSDINSITTTSTNDAMEFVIPSTSSNLNVHQKRTSASSMSSASSASTAGSKTAAFFNSNFDNPIRPATSSNSSSLTSTSKASSPQKSISQNLNNIDSINVIGQASGSRTSLDEIANTSAGVASLGMNNNSFGNEELLARSASNGKRSWIEFDGKPITALPSPGIQGNDGQSDEQNRFVFPPPTEPIDADEQQQHHQHPSLPSIVTNLDVQSSEIKADMKESPRTLNFFGSNSAASSSISSQPLSSFKEGRRSQGLFPFRQPSDNESLHAPSRLPSASASHPYPGLFASDDQNTPRNQQMNAFDSTQSTPKLVLGSQPLVPSAFVSPPSPDPGEDVGGGVKSSFQSFGSSPPVRNGGFTRHTHGPSENVTNSSIVPPAEALQLAGKAADIYRANVDESSTLNDVVLSTPSPQHTPTMEESEDESSNKIGSYTVERVLGMGAFSRVVLARRQRGRQNSITQSASTTNNVQLGDLVALKMLAKEPCRQNERMRVSWVREVEVLRHIIHPNIVRFISSFSTNRHHVLVLETVDGGELFEFLAQNHLEIANREWLVRRIFGELANAVGWMHTINLVHRDIKLENIILTQPLRDLKTLKPNDLPKSPLIKISDFGLSRFIDPNSPLLETRCGSEEYAAPELIIGKRYDGRNTDVWAMGVVLYALLSGSLPFLESVNNNYESGMMNAREDSGTNYQTDPRARKAHLLRIAKGDLRWPELTNDQCLDLIENNQCPLNHRLITPPARLLVARLLRRDANKRISAWEVWDDDWLNKGSFSNGIETSMEGQTFHPPIDPRSTEGQSWLNTNARVQAGAPDVVHDD